MRFIGQIFYSAVPGGTNIFDISSNERGALMLWHLKEDECFSGGSSRRLQRYPAPRMLPEFIRGLGIPRSLGIFSEPPFHQLRLLLPLHFISGQVGFKAATAARFIHSRCTHHDQIFAGDQSLRMLGGIAALHADGKVLVISSATARSSGMGWKGRPR